MRIYQPIYVRLSFTVYLLVVYASSAFALDVSLNHDTLTRLANLKKTETSTIPTFPIGPNRTVPIDFQRVDIYAPGARLYVTTANGRVEIPKSTRIFMRGYAQDGSARVALSLNSDWSLAEGSGSGPDGPFVLNVKKRTGGGNLLSARLLETTFPNRLIPQFSCGNESQNMNFHQIKSPDKSLIPKSALIGSLAPTANSTHSLRLATIAVDTDTLFMSKLFSTNDTTSATNWIASMFNAMNTMYERDLLVGLLQGDTTLRTSGADPYAAANHVPADSTDLNIFGAYWMSNHLVGNPSRAFAMLLSGQATCMGNSCSASGIAWLDQYCEAGFTNGPNTVGSYSVAQVFTNIAVDPNATLAARLVGHELGHNFGASHTHCTDITTGAADVATNTIDQCYNGEAVSGCYAGVTSCPTAGPNAPGAPNGTIMSYCNTRGCGANHQNVLQFHPTQVTVLNGVIANALQNQPGCLNSTEDIFYDGFE